MIPVSNRPGIVADTSAVTEGALSNEPLLHFAFRLRGGQNGSEFIDVHGFG
jgi:hypothetical protein